MLSVEVARRVEKWLTRLYGSLAYMAHSLIMYVIYYIILFVIGNYSKVTYNQLIVRGDAASLDRDASLVTIAQGIRDLYYTSDTYVSV
jgi:hypothetical protein